MKNNKERVVVSNNPQKNDLRSQLELSRAAFLSAGRTVESIPYVEPKKA